jgi:GNAT superfamily N-acetyltransferase
VTQLFDANQVVESKRLRLCRLAATDLESMPWLAAALSPEWQVEDCAAAIDSGCAALVSRSDGAPVGACIVSFDAPVAGAASVPLVAVEPEQRYRGLGSEAALALEQHLRGRHGVEQIFAPVPDGRGLAVYFWLRLGYRPLLGEAAPWPLASLTYRSPPGIWLLRDKA